MSSIPVFEAKTRLSELLVQVQRGDEVTITRHGVPMARLVPVVAAGRAATPSARHRQVDEAMKALGILRQGVTLDMPLREAIEHGRD